MQTVPHAGSVKKPVVFQSIIQPKLTINPSDDSFEQEADAVAEKVMRMPQNDALSAKSVPLVIQRKCAACEDEEKKQLSEEEETEPIRLKPIADLPFQRK